VGESVQRNLSNTIPSAQLITPFLNVKMETLKLCSFLLYFLMIISPFRLFYTVITFYYAFCGATFSRHAVSLNSQCHFTQTCLHEKKSPSKRKENARTYFFQIFKKKSTQFVYETSPAAKTKLDLKNCPIHASNHETADLPKSCVEFSRIVLLRTNSW